MCTNHFNLFTAGHLSLSPEYYEALKLGEVLVAYGRVMMIGPGGGGKTSLRHSLMNMELPELASSTLLADALDVKYHWTKFGDTEGIQYLIELTDDDEIDEIASLLQKIVLSKQLPSVVGSVVAMLESGKQALAVSLFKPTTQDGPSLPEAAENLAFERSVRDTLQEVRARLDRLSHQQHQRSEVLIRLWDCGGQLVFLNILPAFLTPRTLFMLTFDASVDLEEKLEVVTRREGKIVHTEDYHLGTTEMLHQWMASIHSHLCSRRTDGTLEKYPRVMLVGTHRDKLTDVFGGSASSEQRIRHHLRSKYGDKYYSDLLLPSPLYFVDNTRAGKGKDEDPVVREIRSELHEFVLKDLSVPTPVTWVLFRKVMQRTFKGKPVVQLEEVRAIAKACSIPSEAVLSVLNFYHQLGVFLYFADVPGLQDVVIVDPQWLIRNFAKVLSPRGIPDDGMERLWDILHSKGILVQELYQTVLAGTDVEPQALVNLLDRFLLAAPIQPEKGHPYASGKWYFVPSMLSGTVKAPQPYGGSGQPVFEAETLHVAFKSRYVPPGFFVRLIASLAHAENCRVLFEFIDRFNVTFHYGEADRLHLKESKESVEVHMSRRIQAPHIPSFDVSCQKIVHLLEKSIEEVSKWLPSIQMELSFRCKSCFSLRSDYFAFIPLPPSKHLVLLCSKCGQVSLPTTEQQYWMEQLPKHAGGVQSTDSQMCSSGTSAGDKQRSKKLPHRVARTPLEEADYEGMPGTVPLTISNLGNILDLLWEARDKWYFVGLQLGLSVSDLKVINKDSQHTDERFTTMIQKYLEGTAQPTWQAIIKALHRPSVGHETLASQLTTTLGLDPKLMHTHPKTSPYN